MGKFVRSSTTIPLPPDSGGGGNILDYEVSLEGEWVPWSTKVNAIFFLFMNFLRKANLASQRFP